jgi:hypothetical protein
MYIYVYVCVCGTYGNSRSRGIGYSCTVESRRLSGFRVLSIGRKTSTGFPHADGLRSLKSTCTCAPIRYTRITYATTRRAVPYSCCGQLYIIAVYYMRYTLYNIMCIYLPPIDRSRRSRVCRKNEKPATALSRLYIIIIYAFAARRVKVLRLNRLYKYKCFFKIIALSLSLSIYIYILSLHCVLYYILLYNIGRFSRAMFPSDDDDDDNDNNNNNITTID